MISGQSLKKSGVISIILAASGKALSFFTLILVAHLFGANQDTDLIFFLYAQIVLLSGFWTHLNSNILLPSFVDQFSKNPEVAWNKCCSIATHFLMSMIIILPILYYFHPQLLEAFTRWNMSTISNGSNYVLVLIFLFPLIYLNDLFAVVYQSQKHFTYTYLTSICFGSICLISVWFFSKSLGPISLALGISAAALIQLIILLGILRINGFKFTPSWERLNLKEINTMSFIASLMLFFAQFTVAFLPDYFASGLNNGAFTSIFNGRKVLDIMTSLLIFPLVLILYPRMVTWVKEPTPGHKIQMAVRGIIWLCIPLLYLMILLGPIFIQAFFEHGHYTAHNRLISQMSLLILTPGVIFTAFFSLTTRWILAQKSSKILSLFCACLLCSLFLSIPLFEFLTQQYQERGLLSAQLILQVVGFGGISLAFLSKIKAFSIRIAALDFILACLIFAPGIIVHKYTGSLSVGLILMLSIITLAYSFKKQDVQNLIHKLE